MASLSELPRADAAARNLVINPPLPIRAGMALTFLPAPLSLALAPAETACELGVDELSVNGVAESVAAEFDIDPTELQAAESAVQETIRLITSDSGCIPPSEATGMIAGTAADPDGPVPKIAPDRESRAVIEPH